jgi:methionyl-tRNA formyltransferase
LTREIISSAGGGQAGAETASGVFKPSAGPWNIVFFGTAPFAVPALEALASGPERLAAVVAPPPAPAGRGRALKPAATALRARELGLKVLEEPKPNSAPFVEALKALKPDLAVVCAYGSLLKDGLLNLCPVPPLNIHPSLLPRHRGPAPVNWALIAGDSETGVSVIHLDRGMDEGPVLAQARVPVAPGRPAWELEAELSRLGAELLAETVALLKAGRARPRPQDGSGATVNRLLAKADGDMDFGRAAWELAGIVNGCDPWPGARCRLGGKTVKLFGARPLAGAAEPGIALPLDPEGRLPIGTGDGLLAVSEFQPEGRKRLPAAEFARGYRPERFGPAC